MGFKYRDTVLTQLARHGLKPNADTSPDFLHDFISDLYLYEIRRLKSRLRAGLIRRADYAEHVVELRRRYPLLSLPVQQWTEPDL
jgi:hypothetical protein